MITFTDRLDLSASYSETAFNEVRKVKAWLPERVNFYDYKDWLDQQAGERIERFSREIYSHIPCIIFVTCDWYQRPATLLEMKFLSRNNQMKLVVDYAGEFKQRSNEHCISNYFLAEFDENSELSVQSVMKFLSSLNFMRDQF